MKKKKKPDHPTIENRQARYKYAIEETFEAGLVLKGSEVKSIRDGQASIKEGYVVFHGGEMFLHGVHIAPFSHSGDHDQHPAIRNIKLLMHKKEMAKLEMTLEQKKLMMVPIKMYFKANKVKVLLGMGKGKKLFDKREDKKKKDVERSLRQKFRT